MKFERKMGFYDSKRLGDSLFIFHKNHKKFLNDELAKYDLNLIQALCIIMIHEGNVLNQKDLSNGLYLTKGAITKSIKKLENDGWISRERDETDRRHYVLKLTKKSEKLIPTLYEINNKWETKMGLDELDPEFISIFNELTLRAIDLNLKKE